MAGEFCHSAHDCSPHYNGGLLTEAQRAAIEVVLVRPLNPLNIGAAARAMANFGLRRLTVVDPWAPHWREARSAVGAPDLLTAAHQTATLAEAIAGCTLVAGTGTLVYRKPEQEVAALPQLGARLADELRRGGRFAIVFGPEKHGLTREDLALCHLLVEIPTGTRQPSMNLGQAVAVCLYEIAARGSGQQTETRQETSGARAETLERLAELVASTMAASRYSPEPMRTANQHALRVLLRRLDLREDDARRMMGFFRRVLWRLGGKAG
jgi:tRNA/rRNA methyltransferase